MWDLQGEIYFILLFASMSEAVAFSEWCPQIHILFCLPCARESSAEMHNKKTLIEGFTKKLLMKMKVSEVPTKERRVLNDKSLGRLNYCT